jgi:hypothetical protein
MPLLLLQWQVATADTVGAAAAVVAAVAAPAPALLHTLLLSTAGSSAQLTAVQPHSPQA